MRDTNIPVSKAIFDSHSAVRQKIEAANFAVVEALSKKDPAIKTAIALFGRSSVQFGQQLPKSGA